MAKSGNEKITITLNRTTVKTLRQRKRGAHWDAYLLEATNRKCGVGCIECGKWIESHNTDISPDTLARYHGWRSLKENGGATVGFLCEECAKVK